MNHLKITLTAEDGKELYNLSSPIEGSWQEQQEAILAAFEDFLVTERRLNIYKNSLEIVDCVSF